MIAVVEARFPKVERLGEVANSPTKVNLSLRDRKNVRPVTSAAVGPALRMWKCGVVGPFLTNVNLETPRVSRHAATGIESSTGKTRIVGMLLWIIESPAITVTFGFYISKVNKSAGSGNMS